MSEEKKKMRLGKKILIGVGIYVGLGILGITLYGIPTMIEDAQKQKKAAEAEAQAKAQAEEAAKPVGERLQKAVELAQKNNKLNTGVERIIAVRDAFDRGTVDIKINAYWNEDRVIADGCKFGLAVVKEVFARCPEYDIVGLRFFVDMQDQFGNEKESAVFTYNVPRETFSKVNYDNFSDMVIVDYNSMWALADNVYIAPGILRALKKYHK